MGKLIGEESDADAEKDLEQKSDWAAARLILFIFGLGFCVVCLFVILIFIIFLHTYSFGG